MAAPQDSSAAGSAFDLTKAMNDIDAFTADWVGSLVSIQQYLSIPGERGRMVTLLQFLYDGAGLNLGSGTLDINVRGSVGAGWCGVVIGHLVSVEFSGDDRVLLLEDFGQQVHRRTSVRRMAAGGPRSDGRSEG
jgi:hypothetical protein